METKHPRYEARTNVTTNGSFSVYDRFKSHFVEFEDWNSLFAAQRRAAMLNENYMRTMQGAGEMTSPFIIHAATPEALRDAFITFVGARIATLDTEAKHSPSASATRLIALRISELRMLSDFWEKSRSRNPPHASGGQSHDQG